MNAYGIAGMVAQAFGNLLKSGTFNATPTPVDNPTGHQRRTTLNDP